MKTISAVFLGLLLSLFAAGCAATATVNPMIGQHGAVDSALNGSWRYEPLNSKDSSQTDFTLQADAKDHVYYLKSADGKQQFQIALLKDQADYYGSFTVDRRRVDQALKDFPDTEKCFVIPIYLNLHFVPDGDGYQIFMFRIPAANHSERSESISSISPADSLTLMKRNAESNRTLCGRVSRVPSGAAAR